jgi:hypothetical protein
MKGAPIAARSAEVRLAAVVVTALLGPGHLRDRRLYGSLDGAVADQSQALVPEATVEIIKKGFRICHAPLKSKQGST